MNRASKADTRSSCCTGNSWLTPDIEANLTEVWQGDASFFHPPTCCLLSKGVSKLTNVAIRPATVGVMGWPTLPKVDLRQLRAGTGCPQLEIVHHCLRCSRRPHTSRHWPGVTGLLPFPWAFEKSLLGKLPRWRTPAGFFFWTVSDCKPKKMPQGKKLWLSLLNPVSANTTSAVLHRRD